MRLEQGARPCLALAALRLPAMAAAGCRTSGTASQAAVEWAHRWELLPYGRLCQADDRTGSGRRLRLAE